MRPFDVLFLGAAMFCLSTACVANSAEPIALRAGPLTMELDAEHAFLRYIRLGPHEVLRGINAPIRDQNWATISPVVSNIQIASRNDSFEVSFDALCQAGEVDFLWKGMITGSPQGVIEFSFDGVAKSTFKRNRIGFCVLHAATAAGQPWLLKTADGKSIPGHFPQRVSPHQPAKNLQAISHQIAAGIQAQIDLRGDVFEMEDQRNWTDASFKTYCTPLEIPYPVEITAGTKIKQKVRISLTGDLAPFDSPQTSEVTLTAGERRTALPGIGLQVSSEVPELNSAQLDRLRRLSLDHLRVELSLSKGAFAQELQRATEQAVALGVALHVGVTPGPAPDFAGLLNEVRRLKPAVAYWLLTGDIPNQFGTLRSQLAELVGSSTVGVSWTTNFVDLNRSRPQDETIQAVGFAINPQVHAFDNASMMETLPIHAEVVRSAREFLGERPLVIGPVTLSPQWVDGVDQPGGPPAGVFPTYVDMRQGTMFAAAWTLGSLSYLSDAEAQSATYFETVGWNGVMDADDVSGRLAGWPSQPGKVFPIYDLLQAVGEFSGGQVQELKTSDPLSAAGMILHKDGRWRALVANLTGVSQTVALHGLADGPSTALTLAGQELAIAANWHLNLPPYTVALVDGTE